MSAIETANRILAAALLVPVVAPPFTSTMPASKGVRSFTRTAPGQYIVELERPLGFGEGHGRLTLPANLQAQQGVQVRSDGTLFLSVLSLVTGLPIDPPWMNLDVLLYREGEGQMGAPATLPVPPPFPVGPVTPAPFQTDLFIASAGQTNFALSQVPYEPQNVILSVNGQIATKPIDYTVAITVVTWTNASFSLDAGDEVIAYYERL